MSQTGELRTGGRTSAGTTSQLPDHNHLVGVVEVHFSIKLCANDHN